MTKEIKISDETFSRLQAQATPLVDTIETVIARALDALEGDTIAPKRTGLAGPQEYDASSPPNLTFTQVRSIELVGETFLPNQWNALLYAIVDQAMERIGDKEKIFNLITVNRVRGQKTDNGYKYVPSGDVSIQGQDANNAWKAISHIARKTGIPVTVSFMWQDNPKAAKPGEQGRFTILGK